MWKMQRYSFVHSCKIFIENLYLPTTVPGDTQWTKHTESCFPFEACILDLLPSEACNLKGHMQKNLQYREEDKQPREQAMWENVTEFQSTQRLFPVGKTQKKFSQNGKPLRWSLEDKWNKDVSEQEKENRWSTRLLVPWGKGFCPFY